MKSQEFNYCGYQEAMLPLNIGKMTYEGSDCSQPRPFMDHFAASITVPWFTPKVCFKSYNSFVGKV